MPEARAEAVIVEFDGELTIRSAGEARERLLRAFDQSRDICADIAPEAGPDLAFVQLIESARRTAREAGGAFALARPATGKLVEILERGGFLGAPQDREFWLREAGSL